MTTRGDDKNNQETRRLLAGARIKLAYIRYTTSGERLSIAPSHQAEIEMGVCRTRGLSWTLVYLGDSTTRRRGARRPWKYPR